MSEEGVKMKSALNRWLIESRAEPDRWATAVGGWGALGLQAARFHDPKFPKTWRPKEIGYDKEGELEMIRICNPDAKVDALFTPLLALSRWPWRRKWMSVYLSMAINKALPVRLQIGIRWGRVVTVSESDFPIHLVFLRLEGSTIRMGICDGGKVGIHVVPIHQWVTELLAAWRVLSRHSPVVPRKEKK